MEIDEKPIGTTDRILLLFSQKPTSTLKELGNAAGVSRERARQVLKRAGLKTTNRYGPRTDYIRTLSRPDFNYRYGIQLPPHVSGRLGEIYTQIDLIKRGYDVYPALCITAPCDLVVIRNNTIIRIEVRSANRRKNGGIDFVRPKYDRFDVLALVLPTGEIEYRCEPGFSIEGAQ